MSGVHGMGQARRPPLPKKPWRYGSHGNGKRTARPEERRPMGSPGSRGRLACRPVFGGGGRLACPDSMALSDPPREENPGPSLGRRGGNGLGRLLLWACGVEEGSGRPWRVGIPRGAPGRGGRDARPYQRGRATLRLDRGVMIVRVLGAGETPAATKEGHRHGRAGRAPLIFGGGGRLACPIAPRRPPPPARSAAPAGCGGGSVPRPSGRRPFQRGS